MTLSPDALAAQVDELRRHRSAVDDFDVAVIGVSEPGSSMRAYAEAGATWWLEHLHGFRGSVEHLLRRVKAGPITRSIGKGGTGGRTPPPPTGPPTVPRR